MAKPAKVFTFEVMCESKEEALEKIAQKPELYLVGDEEIYCSGLGIELPDGGTIEYPESNSGTIRRKDVHGNTEEVRTVDDDNYLDWLQHFLGTGREFFTGQRVHIDVDNEEWGRVASDATVLEVHNEEAVGETDYLLLSVDSIQANITVPCEEAHPIMELGKHFDPDFEDFAK